MNGLLALAFAAGMLAPVNPCGFALLPAWITAALGEADTSPVPVRLARALRSGAALTLGFAGTLAAAGLIVSAGARALIAAAPWLGLATGIILLLLGAFMLTGRSLGLQLNLSTGTRGSAGPPTARRMVVFGVGYAAASLSCTFGVLLAVIAQAQATASFAGLLAVFAAYATGSAAVLLLVAVTTAAAGAALTRKITALARHGTRITAAVLVLTGAYLAWYWYPAATGGPATATPGGGLATWSATATAWIQGHTITIAVTALAVVLAVTAAALRHRRRPARHAAPTGAAPLAEADCCPPQPVPTPAAPDRDNGGHCC
ncbi:cytochrome c biogenesis protein CcdA [Streptomyces sp. A3M-1-3]|uniref:cytochrome c biogenesis CcdA family protein n=1 Tax=Streptomyces sp. A3M-1-3 TaxID=2962044 RepID=UPI0020B8BBD4|nr:cytochrome c biogenesis protein CcdA [Streptomyces sp. A3M-1-3]MCP3818844.1 cytochrome c biogenesis protein CcdA [Streptomyces sp. A3M-1-3]